MSIQEKTLPVVGKMKFPTRAILYWDEGNWNLYPLKKKHKKQEE